MTNRRVRHATDYYTKTSSVSTRFPHAEAEALDDMAVQFNLNRAAMFRLALRFALANNIAMEEWYQKEWLGQKKGPM